MEAYLTNGEYLHSAYHPEKDFLSGLLDITIVKPVIESLTGEDMITKERLSDSERAFKSAGAMIDLFTFGQGTLMIDFMGYTGKEALEAFGRTVLVDVFANSAAYTVSYGAGALGLPPEINWILSVTTGCTISVAGGDYILRSLDGSVTKITAADVREIAKGNIKDEWKRFLGDNRGRVDFGGSTSVVDDVVEGGLNSYADFSKAVSDIGMRSDLTDAQKISELQKLFESSNYKADINVPSDIQYVKGFDTKGNVIYDWPPKLGFDESTIKPISRTDGLPDTWDRYGYMGGSNFAVVPSTGKYAYSERAIPYVENEAAYHTGTFNNATYFDKIDAIKNGDMDTFNELLQNEGISKWDLDDFEELCDSYDSFISKANKELGDSVDATYGIKGLAAEWGDMSGGAGQIVTPFGGDVLEKIGILKEN